jgi:hypothetical protein
MKLNTNQRIIVWCNRAQGLEIAILYALYIALFLKKEICFFANYRNNTEKALFSARIDTMIETYANHLNLQPYSILLLKGNLKRHIVDLADRYDSVLFCCPGKISYSLLNAFYRSRTPFLFTREAEPVANQFRRLYIPVDFRQSAKDSALWGSYFGRLNHSEVLLIKPDDRDQDLRLKVGKNFNSIVGLYSKFHFPYSVLKGKSSSWNIHRETLALATSADLLVFSGSFNVSLPDYLIGPFERRLVNRSQKVPILLINPRYEMCVLCD